MTSQSVREIDHEHADVSGGWLRPAVFGAMDGLVTNIALIAGVGGAGVSPNVIVLTGAAGLVSGAISMGLGEYTSVKASNEQVAAEVAKERRELARNPSAEARESLPTAGWSAACRPTWPRRWPKRSRTTRPRRCAYTCRRSWG